MAPTSRSFQRNEGSSPESALKRNKEPTQGKERNIQDVSALLTVVFVILCSLNRNFGLIVDVNLVHI